MSVVRGDDRVHEVLSLAYDGPGMTGGTMDVRALAPSLLALSGLFQEANRLVYPTAPDVALEIRATERGSFDVDLQLVADAAVVVLAADPATALANLKALVIDPAAGLVRFLLRRKATGEREQTRQPLDSGAVRVTYADGTSVEFPAPVERLSRSTTVRRELEAVVRPLDSAEIDEVALRASSTETISIVTDDLGAIRSEPGDDSPIDEQTMTMTLAVVAPSFDGKKWRTSDGHTSFWVSILDSDFLAAIEQGERFGKGDFLRCEVRFSQYLGGPNGLRLERNVVKVLEHRRRPDPPDGLFE